MIELRRKCGNWGIDNGFREWEMRARTVSPLRGSTLLVGVEPGTDVPGYAVSPIRRIARWHVPVMQIPRSLRELVMTKTKNTQTGSAAPRMALLSKKEA